MYNQLGVELLESFHQLEHIGTCLFHGVALTLVKHVVQTHLRASFQHNVDAVVVFEVPY